MAASIVLLVAGGMFGWFLASGPGQGAAPATAVARQAAYYHALFAPEIAYPVDIPAAQREHLVAWLSWRVGTVLRLPRLTGVGYTLVGGRLLTGVDGGPAAQFLYEDAGGYRLSLYITRQADWHGEGEARYAEENGVSVLYWIDGTMGYALTAALARERLRHVASVVIEQLGS